MVVMASGRWLGVRLDLIASLMTTAVALSAVLVSQDAGRYCANNTQQLHQTTTKYTELQQTTPNYSGIPSVIWSPMGQKNLAVITRWPY